MWKFYIYTIIINRIIRLISQYRSMYYVAKLIFIRRVLLCNFDIGNLTAWVLQTFKLYLKVHVRSCDGINSMSRWWWLNMCHLGYVKDQQQQNCAKKIRSKLFAQAISIRRSSLALQLHISVGKCILLKFDSF